MEPQGPQHSEQVLHEQATPLALEQFLFTNYKAEPQGLPFFTLKLCMQNTKTKGKKNIL